LDISLDARNVKVGSASKIAKENFSTNKAIPEIMIDNNLFQAPQIKNLESLNANKESSWSNAHIKYKKYVLNVDKPGPKNQLKLLDCFVLVISFFKQNNIYKHYSCSLHMLSIVFSSDY
jgi:hypothetical protein